MQKSKISEMRNGWVEQSRGAVAGAQAVGVKFRRRMGRSLVTHYQFSIFAVDRRNGKVVYYFALNMNRNIFSIAIIIAAITHRGVACYC